MNDVYINTAKSTRKQVLTSLFNVIGTTKSKHLSLQDRIPYGLVAKFLKK